MDGPNVNFKFYRDLIADRLIEHPAAPLFLDLGFCGLHVVHGAFKTGVNATGSKIDNLLRSLYYLFSDLLQDMKITPELPVLPFSTSVFSTRWVEDVPVAERAVEMWTNICKYIEVLDKKSKSKKKTQVHHTEQL